MRTLKPSACLAAIAVLMSLTAFGAWRFAQAAAAPPQAQSGAADPSPINSQAPAPSRDEIRAKADKFVANQHRDDDALEQYERIEHHVDRTAGSNPRTVEDKVYRVVPTGAGTAKIVIREEDKPVDAALYNREMQGLKDTLQMMANPNDYRTKSAYAKRQKRQADRAEFVEAAKEAFSIKWLGNSTFHGRACDVFELDPNPDFRPHGLFQEALIHVTAKIWVDHETTQMARGEAHVTSDVSFGGGILGKLYRGSVVTFEQAEVAPGIWLPTHMQYDFSGRKFVFSFEQHQLIDAGHYRRVGPPNEALALVQNELANGKPFYLDP